MSANIGRLHDDEFIADQIENQDELSDSLDGIIASPLASQYNKISRR